MSDTGGQGTDASTTDFSSSGAERKQLEAEHEQLKARVGELETGTDAAMSFDDNFADSAQVAAEQGENKSLASQLRKELDDVESALARLDDGTYGQCTECGAAITPARLEAMPTASTCIDHA